MVGETLGSYRIIAEIGKGGMGVVYLAEHTLLGRKAAVKVLRSGVANDQVERFFNEARAAATLHHPGLVDVFDFGHHRDGSAYIVMEFLPGESLAERLDRDPRLPVPIACAIARSVAIALQVAHEQGIIHRDLKPANIFLVPDAESPAGVRTKVLDFGIAKLQRQTDERSAVTNSGAVIGTPRYMSPEQCKNARSVDGRADIYSLGCILYEMLVGAAPFVYDSWAELVGAHLYEVPARPTELEPTVPVDVETLVIKMLEKLPSDRFQSMQDLAQSIEVVLHTHGGATRLTPPQAMRPVLTPSRGVKPIGREVSDPTLPAASSDASGAIKRDVQPAVASSSPVPAVAQAATGTRPVVQAKPLPWLAIAIGGAGMVALAIAATLVFTNDRSRSHEPAFIVVDQRGSGGAPSGAGIRDPDDELPKAKPVEQDPIDEDRVDAGVESRVQVKPRAETDTAQLTRAFGRQTGKVTACFRRHQNPVSEQIFVRVQIDTSGRVIAAEVLPAAAASAPLGACIAGVARETAFGPQPKAATFRVPIHTNLGP